MTDVSMAMAKHINEQFEWLKMASDGPGNNLFVNDWPDSPDEAYRLVRYEGAPPSETFANAFQVRHPRVQLTVRGKKSYEVLDRADQIMKALNIKDATLFGVDFQRIKPVGEPFEIGPDSSGRERAVVNFSVDFYDQN